MNIVLNYDYGAYPYTTASYLEMAAKQIEGIKCFREGGIDSRKVDLVINVMPFKDFVCYEGVPCTYWEIDCHILKGCKPYYYNKCDKVYIAQKYFMDEYPDKKTSYLPLACHPEVHKRIKDVKQQYDIGFIGNDTYPERRLLLEQINQNYHLLRTNTPPGLPYSTELSKCIMTFNRSLNHDVNMRFFEAIACGRLLLTDYLPEQDEFAEVGRHYDIFDDWEALDFKIHYYLDHAEAREKIALAGSEHIRKHHTYRHRLLKILSDFGWKGK